MFFCFVRYVTIFLTAAEYFSRFFMQGMRWRCEVVLYVRKNKSVKNECFRIELCLFNGQFGGPVTQIPVL